MASSTRKEKILNSISPLSLVAIVALNILLVYMNLVSLENQNIILADISENTEIALTNQEIGLNITQQTNDMLRRIIQLQERDNNTISVAVMQPHVNNTGNHTPDFYPLLVVQNQSNNNSNLSSNVIELQSEVIRLRNQLEPRNISEAFPLYPQSSVEGNNTYAEEKEGSIAGLNFSKFRGD